MLASFFARLQQYRFIIVSSSESMIGAATVDFLGHTISFDGLRPKPDIVFALVDIAMANDINNQGFSSVLLATTANFSSKS